MNRPIPTATSIAGFLLLLLALLAPRLPAQNTFVVTVGPKSAGHPYAGQGASDSYRIDGVDGAELNLVRGTTYTFQMQDIPFFHPFYISMSEVGAGALPYNEGLVTNNFADSNETLTFTPGESTPPMIYYQCGVHERMGWRINVSGGGAGVEEEMAANAVRLSHPIPNPVRGASTLLLRSPRSERLRVVLFDVTGRQVATLFDGFAAGEESISLTLDASGLPPGMYDCAVIGGPSIEHRSVMIVR